jgi:Terminase RNaseH-like domain
MRHVGGIDFGFRNPFAALWGFVDRDDVLWLTGEHYARQRPLSFHADKLPPNVMWYADPSGANEIAELNCAGFTVRKGSNSLRTGIAAVTARLESGTLRVLEGACPNLLAEAGMYCYGDNATERRAEVPVDENNHASAALRYLVARLDAHRLVKRPKDEAPPDGAAKPAGQGLDEDDERWWMPLN